MASSSGGGESFSEQQIASACDEVLAHCRNSGEGGVTADSLGNALDGKLSVELRAIALNRLLQTHHVQMLQNSGKGDMIFKAKDPELVSKMKGLSKEAVLVLQAIEQAGDCGIFSRHLKSKTGIASAVLSKCVKALQRQDLIKELVLNKRKHYFLYDLTPSVEVTGGVFYNGDELDTAFVDALRSAVMTFFKSRDRITVADVEVFLRESRISSVDLKLKDVRLLMSSLVYDRQIEITPDCDVENSSYSDSRSVHGPFYRLVGQVDQESRYCAMPCCTCPVASACCEGNSISPSNCKYFSNWLKF